MSAWVWLALGVTLLVAEVFVPGMVVAFLGLGALSVALAVALDLVHELPATLGLWIGTSLVYLLGLRRFAQRRFPGEMKREIVDDEVLVHGQVVDVVEAVSESAGGRVRFQGSTWPARTIEGRIERGSRAVIVYREDLSLVVEPEEPGR